MVSGRITVLVENTAGGRGLLAEHGLAFWIELGDRKVLFDTGQGNVLLGNARRLGIRLEQLDAIVISHGHYDHTGGLSDALRAARRATVYAHQAAFSSKYSRNPGGGARDIGMPQMDEQTIRDMADLVLVDRPTQICEGFFLTGPIPRMNDFEDTGGPFFMDSVCTDPDPLLDDQATFVETPAGTVVILGCAHAGIINTLQYIQSLTNSRPIQTVIGGMHLLHASRERMDKTVAELRRLNVHRLLPCHCTGLAAIDRLWNEFPGRCAACPVGTVLEMAG